MSAYDILINRRDEIYCLAGRYGVTQIRVFGSVSQKQETDSSDIDLLIDVDPDRSLLDLALFSNELEDILGRKVDLVTEPALHPLLRTQILQEAVAL
jgi:hypothetical protein